MKPDAILQVPDGLEKRGFVEAKTASTKWPIVPWAKGAREKSVGELYLRDFGSALEGFSTRLLTEVLGWSHHEMTELIKQVAVELHSGKMHAYLPINILCAQKPVDARAQ
ncbi:hypothetical protein Q7P35_008089 [Cladosporium inversicolor]